MYVSFITSDLTIYPILKMKNRQLCNNRILRELINKAEPKNE